MSLPRGVKLVREAFGSPLTAAAGVLASVDHTEMERPFAPWDIQFYIPVLNEIPYLSTEPCSTAVFFTLPPVQDQFPVDGSRSVTPDGETPQRLILEEVHFGWDSRDEAWGLHTNTHKYDGVPAWPAAGAGISQEFLPIVLVDPAATPPSIDISAEIRRLAVTLELWEKTPNYWQQPIATKGTLYPDRCIWSYTIPALAWGQAQERSDDPTLSDEAKSYRMNPFVITGLNVELDQLKSYYLEIKVPGLKGTPATPPVPVPTAAEQFSLAMPNVQVTLKGKARLLPRDAWNGQAQGTSIQNAPTGHINRVAPTITITTPTANALIKETGAGGLHDELDVLDTVLRAQLKGGMGRESVSPYREHVLDGAAYKVLAVPLWSYVYPYGKVSAMQANVAPGAGDPEIEDLAYIPYAISSAEWPAMGFREYRNPTADRRIIRLPYPFVVHQVVAARSRMAPVLNRPNGTHLWSQNAPATIRTWPSSATWTMDVGVGIGCGLRSQRMAYQQVAYAQYTAATVGNYTIDRLNMNTVLPWATTNGDYELLHVPLIGGVGPFLPGPGYGGQGVPFFVGPSETPSTDRTFVCQGLGQAPATAGQEQYLEVRWGFWDANGLEQRAGAEHNGGHGADVYVGLLGCWVYIIGKRMLTEG